jgi:hypothetical protein
MISFRVSEDDYNKLVTICQTASNGTASRAARAIVCAFLKTGGDARRLALSVSLQKLEGSMTELSKELRRLSQTIEP